jgi:hypothetical protein
VPGRTVMLHEHIRPPNQVASITGKTQWDKGKRAATLHAPMARVHLLFRKLLVEQRRS